MSYYVKGGSIYNSASDCMLWLGLFLGGFPEADYGDVDWTEIDYGSYISNDDPYMRFGGSLGAQSKVELGLYGNYLVEVNTYDVEVGNSLNSIIITASEENNYQGAHNFSGITTTANYFKGSGGLTYETLDPPTEGTDIAWVDSATLYHGECIIVESWQSHNNVLRLLDDATGGEDPYITHNFSTDKSGIFEFWIGTNDVTETWQAYIWETGNDFIIRLEISASKLWYRDRADAWQEIQAVANDTFYHIKIEWRDDDTFDLYVGGTKHVDDQQTNNIQSTGTKRFYFRGYGDSTAYLYIDAPGLVGEEDPEGYVYEESWNTLDGDIDELLDEGYKIDGALGGSYIRVTDVGGHEDVLTIYDNQNNIDIYDRPIFKIPNAVFGTQTYGTVEFLLRTDDATYANIVQLIGTGGSTMIIRIDADDFYYTDSGGINALGIGASDDTWYHIRIAFECTTGEYEGLAQYNFKFWVNGIEYGDYDMQNNCTNVKLIQFYTNPADNGYHMYIDAVDFSWATGYFTNRNMMHGSAIKVDSILCNNIIGIENSDYATAHHNRAENLIFLPANGVTAGANNVYWSVGKVTFGVTSLGNGHAKAQFVLPDDYISGEDITFEIWYRINSGGATIDYDVDFYYSNESTDLTRANNPTGQWTANATANRPSKDTLTITGTNISAGDVIRILLEMDDNAVSTVLYLMKVRLLIPVESRS